MRSSFPPSMSHRGSRPLKLEKATEVLGKLRARTIADTWRKDQIQGRTLYLRKDLRDRGEVRDHSDDFRMDFQAPTKLKPMTISKIKRIGPEIWTNQCLRPFPQSKLGTRIRPQKFHRNLEALSQIEKKPEVHLTTSRETSQWGQILLIRPLKVCTLNPPLRSERGERGRVAAFPGAT